MKKYLMTGVAALAFAATFTSCSNHDGAEYNPEAQVRDSYKTAFVKTFGQPASSQDWGFGSLSGAATRAATRTLVNVNGNLWETCPNLLTASETGTGKSEETMVYEYVNMTLAQMRANQHKYGTDLPDDLTNFFVTQVHTGDTKYNTWSNEGNTDESKMILGSSHMNNLQIGESSEAKINNGALSTTGWYHCNNFNAGNNTDWNGNTLFEESGTFDFAYHSSSDNRYHNRWIAVKGEDINPILAGRYYVCFDFISEVENGNPYTYFKIKSMTDHRIPVSGVWRNAQQLIDAGITTVTVNEYVWNNETNSGSFQDVIYTVDATDWVQDGIDNPNQVIPADDVYTDWIIRIVPAVAKPETYHVRIIAEDLSASEDTDFDFNDVVFDVKYDDPTAASTGAKIRVVAAGGTLPLYVYAQDAAHEVHALFQAANQDKSISTSTMINTYAGRHNEYTHAYFTISSGLNPAVHGRDIKIYVVKPNAQGVETTYELTAQQGEPAAKVAVLPTFQYCDEFASIKGTFPKFLEWVQQGANVKWYYAENGQPVDK